MNREQINNLINTCQQEIRRLQEENKQLKEQLQQKEDIINKAKEKLNHLQTTYGYTLDDVIFLLDKGE